MNKKIKVLLIVLGVIVSLVAILRLTSLLQVYNIPSGANYPALKPGDRIFATNLTKPDRLDLICYKADDPYMGKHIRVHRVGAVEDDKVEMRDGVLYVNDKEIDSKLDLAHPHYISRNDLTKLPEIENITGDNIEEHGSDSMRVNINESLLRKYSIPARRYVIPKHESQADISAKFGSPWNQDHFGPVAVPV